MSDMPGKIPGMDDREPINDELSTAAANAEEAFAAFQRALKEVPHLHLSAEELTGLRALRDFYDRNYDDSPDQAANAARDWIERQLGRT